MPPNAKSLRSLPPEARQPSELAQVKQELQEVTNEVLMLQKFFLATSQLHFKLDPQYVYKTLCDILKEYVGCQSCAIFLTRQKDMLDLVGGLGDKKEFIPFIPFVTWIVQQGRTFNDESPAKALVFQEWQEWAQKNKIEFYEEYKPRAVYPLKTFEESIGAIVIVSLLEGKKGLGPQDYQFLDLLADHAATAIVSSRLHEEMKSLVAEKTEHLNALNNQLNLAMEELKQANKELESFSYSVSHDLRAPLRAIEGFSQALLEEYANKMGSEGDRYLNIIGANTKRMGQLIDDLLSFSRVGRKELTKTDVNMSELARSVAEELKIAGGPRIIQLHIGDLPAAYGDSALLRQVFANLISNAFKFTRKKATAIVEIGGYVEGDENVYYVKDNGVGFDMKYKDKLFGVFQRLHSMDEFEGTGIGLSIVQRVIHRHGGRVWGEGKVGEGAQFYFTIRKDI